MKTYLLAAFALLHSACFAAGSVVAPVKEINTDGKSVIPVQTKRGVATFIEFEQGERIKFSGSGLSGNCGKPEDAWCIAAPLDTNVAFVKPRTKATSSNVVHIVTDRRSYTFELSVLDDGSKGLPMARLIVRGPAAAPQRAATASPASTATTLAAAMVQVPPALTNAELVKERLKQAPAVVNSAYSVSLSNGAEDIRPSLVYDDGRFTYFRFPGNREIPAVFQRDSAGEESIVNARMEGDLLVADRVTRRMVLRLGNLAVGIYNDAYDAEGVPAVNNTTVSGVERVLR